MNKTPEKLIEGTQDLIKYIGKPEQIYSDQEGALNSPEWIRFRNGLNIKHLTTITGALTVESFNRTLKHLLGTRITSKNTSKQEWVSELLQVLRKT